MKIKTSSVCFSWRAQERYKGKIGSWWPDEVSRESFDTMVVSCSCKRSLSYQGIASHLWCGPIAPLLLKLFFSGKRNKGLAWSWESEQSEKYPLSQEQRTKVCLSVCVCVTFLDIYDSDQMSKRISTKFLLYIFTQL